MKKYLFILLIILISCTKQDFVEINGEKITVEIADSEQEREKGLMFREELCDKCGMLFIFEQEDIHTFWMKNTLIPLDIIFIDSNLNIVDIIYAEPCFMESCEIYTPKEKSLYVLETNADKFNQEIIGKKVKIFS